MTRCAVVLAAGKGTRFRSDLPKVLHHLAGRTMLRWVLEAVRPLGLDRVVVVVGHGAEAVRAQAEDAGVDGLVVVEQTQQLGTGHAVATVVEAGALEGCEHVVVLPGDTPLLDADTIGGLMAAHEGVADRAVTLLTTELDDPTGYGRVVRDGQGAVLRIVEHGDASPEQHAIREVGTSIYAFAAEPLVAALAGLGTHNVQGEQYLTDAVEALVGQGVGARRAPPEVVAGVNDRAQLAEAEAVLRGRILRNLMRAGVSVADPSTTYVHADVRVGPDAVLLPGTHLEGSTTVAGGAVIGPDTRLVDTRVAQGATVTYSLAVGADIGPDVAVGPFTYLRPGTRLERGAKAGAFVEMKQSTIGEGSKVPHLSYVGDATIGRGVNVGAATVTVNYDGRDKHRTIVGDGAFIGSDTMLVAPVQIGEGAYTAAGSVITKDVPAGALAVERNAQRIVEGYADRKRARGGHDDGQDRA